jgi:hypothetical protein
MKKLICTPNGVGFWSVSYRNKNVGLYKSLSEVRYWFPVKTWKIIVDESWV